MPNREAPDLVLAGPEKDRSWLIVDVFAVKRLCYELGTINC